MKPASLTWFLVAPAICLGAENSASGDIDCDGKADFAQLVQSNARLLLKVELSGEAKVNELVFGLGRADRQDSLSGVHPTLGVEQLSDDLSDALGENPQGYTAVPGCFGLNISDGESDSIHIYWNSEARMLNWWRL